jgi:hypothetical protein
VRVPSRLSCARRKPSTRRSFSNAMVFDRLLVVETGRSAFWHDARNVTRLAYNLGCARIDY